MKQVSWCDDTVKSRIADMVCSIKSQLIVNIKASPALGIQLDELVDVANLSQLMVYVWSIHKLSGRLPFLQTLQTTTNATEDLNSTRINMSLLVRMGLLLSLMRYLASLNVKRKNLNVITTQCIIHQEALASRTMSQPLKQALHSAIKVVNYIEACTVHCLVKMLIRLVLLLPEVAKLLEIQQGIELKPNISDMMFQNRLAFLADMFCHLNDLNRKLQGVNTTILGQQTRWLPLQSFNSGR